MDASSAQRCAPETCPGCRRATLRPPPPSPGGTAPGVVKDSGDKEIAGKLELLQASESAGGARCVSCRQYILGRWCVCVYVCVCMCVCVCLCARTRARAGSQPVAGSVGRGRRPCLPHAPHPTVQGINCFAEPGELTALMGGSGAGKTTLMVRAGGVLGAASPVPLRSRTCMPRRTSSWVARRWA